MDLQETAMSQFPHPILVLELGRDTPATTSTELAALASHYVSCGAHAIALQTCNDDGTCNLGDLFAVVRAVRAPVLQSDWFLHPIQVRFLISASACVQEIQADEPDLHLYAYWWQAWSRCLTIHHTVQHKLAVMMQYIKSD